MMTFFAFLAVLAICVAIARYNENDGLFWKLALSFAGAYAAYTVVTTVIDNKKEDKVVMINDNPTQVHKSVSYAPFVMRSTTLGATRREKSQKPVSKDTVIKKSDSILSKVFVSARGQPQVSSVSRILNELTYFDTS